MNTPNIDPAEVAKFSAMAAHWWDMEGQFKTLHAINPLRLKFILEKVNIQDLKVLDVGCGGGILAESLARAGAMVTAIDMSAEALQVAKLHGLESHLHIEYIKTTVEELANQRAGEYDVITCLEMLEHVPDPVSIVKACAQLAKPNAHLFFSTINRNLKAYLFAIIGAEYILKLLPQKTHDFDKFIKPAELSRWARAENLIVKEFAGINYNPLNQHYSLSKDIAVNYLMHATRSL